MGILEAIQKYKHRFSHVKNRIRCQHESTPELLKFLSLAEHDRGALAGAHSLYMITNLIDPLGGNWNILTGAAFLSFIIPMIVFFSFQRYFARGTLSGWVKG